MENNEINEKVIALGEAIAELKQLITTEVVSDEWINKELVAGFMGYKSSQMATILKTGQLEYSKVGRRTFISRKSLSEFLNKNRSNGNQ